MLGIATVRSVVGAGRLGWGILMKNPARLARAIESAASLISDYGGVESQLGKHLSDGLPRYEIPRPDQRR